MIVEASNEVVCFHCRQSCDDEIRWVNEKSFCCYGCQTVYEILAANSLCEYYTIEERSALPLKKIAPQAFAFLDEMNIRKKIVSFDSDTFAKVEFHVPAIHCISCIWLLENLQRIDPGVLRSEVNFAQKKVAIEFNPAQLKLSALAGVLASLGYAPSINLADGDATKPVSNRSLIIKLSVAGFCFGNVMLFSFPEYLGLDQSDEILMRLFSWLNLLLSVPVMVYSASDYFTSAAKTFKQKQINIDVPIAAGLIALFLRSSYDIISASGPGYLDSFTGLVFFLLIGRWFQSKTYESLAFDRDFKSYFPLAVSRLEGDEWKSVVIYDLAKGDHIQVRNMEVVPADSVLLSENAFIDYSFVTGESKPVKIKAGDYVYAGGRLIGKPVSLVIDRKTSQSQLTMLWNNPAFKKANESKYQKMIDRAAKRFTWVVIGIAFVTAVYWRVYDPAHMWLVLTSVLMVACPCALALAAPFTYGSMLRVFGENQFYLKNADVIERLANIDAVVFDKTGTVTHGEHPEIEFEGELTNTELSLIKTLAVASTHPLSQLISRKISAKKTWDISMFKEVHGKGVQGVIDGKFVQIGSAEFLGITAMHDPNATYVFVGIDNSPKGYFAIRTAIRENLKRMLDRLGNKCVALLSGDNEADRVKMTALFDPAVQLLFNQTPQAKLEFIGKLQRQNRRVLMVGDGLNDSGALKQSDVGVAITDDTGVFTPACDGILTGKQFPLLDKFLALAKSSTAILKTAFAISFLYNAIALTFAVTGNLTPLTAAILMPMSSISVVGFSSIAVNYVANKKLSHGHHHSSNIN